MATQNNERIENDIKLMKLIMTEYGDKIKRQRPGHETITYNQFIDMVTKDFSEEYKAEFHTSFFSACVVFYECDRLVYDALELIANSVKDYRTINHTSI